MVKTTPSVFVAALLIAPSLVVANWDSDDLYERQPAEVDLYGRGIASLGTKGLSWLGKHAHHAKKFMKSSKGKKVSKAVEAGDDMMNSRRDLSDLYIREVDPQTGHHEHHHQPPQDSDPARRVKEILNRIVPFVNQRHAHGSPHPHSGLDKRDLYETLDERDFEDLDEFLAREFDEDLYERGFEEDLFERDNEDLYERDLDEDLFERDNEDLYERDLDEELLERDLDEELLERDLDEELFERDLEEDLFERDLEDLYERELDDEDLFAREYDLEELD
jgi:hypothetical protein